MGACNSSNQKTKIKSNSAVLSEQSKSQSSQNLLPLSYPSPNQSQNQMPWQIKSAEGNQQIGYIQNQNQLQNNGNAFVQGQTKMRQMNYVPINVNQQSNNYQNLQNTVKNLPEGITVNAPGIYFNSQHCPQTPTQTILYQDSLIQLESKINNLASVQQQSNRLQMNIPAEDSTNNLPVGVLQSIEHNYADPNLYNFLESLQVVSEVNNGLKYNELQKNNV